MLFRLSSEDEIERVGEKRERKREGRKDEEEECTRESGSQ